MHTFTCSNRFAARQVMLPVGKVLAGGQVAVTMKGTATVEA